MWIRSQDKKQLVNANELYIATRSIGYCISTGKGNDLASYLSEEKAIIVLDKLQKQIMLCEQKETEVLPLTPNGFPPYIAKAQNVFQMPQDSEVE